MTSHTTGSSTAARSRASKRSDFRILVVDDDDRMRELLSCILRPEGYEVVTASGGEEAIARIGHEYTQMAFLDVVMPGLDGIETLLAMKRIQPTVDVVILTGHGTVERAVEAMKYGAQEFLLKPVDRGTIRNIARRTELQHRGVSSSWNLSLGEPMQTERVVTADGGMRATMDMAVQVAPLPCTVLIEGESGTGKELVARQIHESSARAQNSFVAVNCAAIPDQIFENELFGHEPGAFTGAGSLKRGYFEAARGGTIFLDEVGEMSVDVQAKLLRVLQERTFRRVGGVKEIPADVRVIAATNRDLLRETERGTFRRDLFYRLNVVRVSVPALRDRPNDIPLLSGYFLRRYAEAFRKQVTSIDHTVIDRFMSHPWSGNVRELQNVIESSVAMAKGSSITLSDLSEVFFRSAEPNDPKVTVKPFQEAKNDFEARYLVSALENAKGNMSLASRLSGLSRQHLYGKLARLGIKHARYRGTGKGDVA